ncbi:MAG: GNAT family N-acetyltransferase, partial [bacterium]|nr:GNAT family N-acetyltransferase [bacterium]
EEAAILGVRNVFALTYVDKFFIRLGFRRIDKKTLPHKIWSDCMDCVYFPNCKEIAVIKRLK